jgi:SecD/SecF fusion protein
MQKPSIWKWLILAALVAWSLGIAKDGFNLGIDLQGGTSFLLQVDLEDLEEDERSDAPARALEVIRNRVDAFGGKEPVIYLQPGTDRIVVQIPGIDDETRRRLRENIMRAAKLDFKMVHEDSAQTVQDLLTNAEAPVGYKVVDAGNDKYLRRDKTQDPEGATDQDIYKQRRTFKAPVNTEMMLIKEVINGVDLYTPAYVERRIKLGGKDLKTAGVQQDSSRLVPTYVVTLQFNSEGSDVFRRLTVDFAPGGDRNPNPDRGRQLGIVLDGTLFSAPEIRTPIYGGNAQIEGSFTYEDARDLALVLRAGSLPAPVEIIEERTVAATLGQDSIKSSFRALLLGASAVVVFVILYYLIPGLIAIVALSLDVMLLPLGMMVAAGFMGLFTGAGTWSGPIGLPTLTLAGIAGIVLTIGMAVDANVLIFERIREEQKAGKRFASAVDAGYEKVFSTIFDANITTLLTAIILFWQGSGPIRGFAITLSAGIIVSMYVALVGTRMMFDLLGYYTKINSVKMMSLVSGTSIDFLGKRHFGAALSALIIIGSWFAFFGKGVDNFGVDFTGGTAISYEVSKTKTLDLQEIRGFLESSGLNAQLQTQREMAGEDGEAPDQFLEAKVSFGEGERLAELMAEKYGTETEGGLLQYSKTESVGPQVGKELQKRGIKAMIWALVGIVIYITVRFEFGFAIGAIVALLHDVLVTVGIYCLFGRQLSLPIVAALLTIVGYSVNDTIVIFDRIREDLSLNKGKPYKDVANIAINRTLARTLLTSITTLLTVVMLLVFGGGAINDFALALLIGILVGTYSSIFVATPVTLMWHRDAAAKAGSAGK